MGCRSIHQSHFRGIGQLVRYASILGTKVGLYISCKSVNVNSNSTRAYLNGAPTAGRANPAMSYKTPPGVGGSNPQDINLNPTDVVPAARFTGGGKNGVVSPRKVEIVSNRSLSEKAKRIYFLCWSISIAATGLGFAGLIAAPPPVDYWLYSFTGGAVGAFIFGIPVRSNCHLWPVVEFLEWRQRKS